MSSSDLQVTGRAPCFRPLTQVLALEAERCKANIVCGNLYPVHSATNHRTARKGSDSSASQTSRHHLKGIPVMIPLPVDQVLHPHGMRRWKVIGFYNPWRMIRWPAL
jgi:hypothetical protein